MNNALFRSLVIYAACVLLAILFGFLLAGPLTYSSVLFYGIVAFILFFPVLLRWHYPLMLLCWNFAAVAFVLPGRPSVGLVMIMLSLGISVMQRMVNSQSQFIRVPRLTLPILCMVAVVAFTAKMRGVGLHVFGSDVYGGKKYVYLIAGILGYFALSAQRIPPERRSLYIKLFFLAGVTAAIGDLVSFLPHSFYFIYWFFNYNTYAFHPEQIGPNVTRFTGAWPTSFAIFSYMLARYGIRGIFLSGKPLRWMVFILTMIYGCFGGFRGLIVMFGMVFMVQFFAEGLHRTKLLPMLMLSGFLGALALIPLSDHLPYTFQRAISFLPYKVSTAARLDGQASLDWRFQMWKAVLPEIPRYLLLGKGYVINPLDYEFVMGPEASVHNTFAQNDPLALAEDYHNGPLSTVIPFGIWGCIAILWFFAAALRVLYLNYRYSEPELKTVNAFLFAAFTARVIFYLFMFGDFSSDMLIFCGWLGLSVALNHGVRRPVRVVQPARETAKSKAPAQMPLPAPAFQRRLPGIQ